MWSLLHVRWGDPPHVTSPTWGPPPPCKEAVTGGYRSSTMTTLMKIGSFEAYRKMVTNWLVSSCLSLCLPLLTGARDARGCSRRTRYAKTTGDESEWKYKGCHRKMKNKKKGSWKKLNKNKLGTLTTFRDLVWRKSGDENILIISMLPFLKSTDIEMKYYYTALQKCFQIIKISKRYLHT